MSKKSRENLFRVTSPCSQDWDAMQGNDKVRFCEHCASAVNNLSAMRRKDAMRLVRESEGGICVRYVKNPANDKPLFAENLYQIARRAPRLAVGAMTAAISLSSMAYAQGGVSPAEPLKDKIEVSKDKKDEKNKVESVAGSLSGTIKDVNGAVIPGINVTLTDEGGTVNRAATSNDEGFYEFNDVANGNDYKLTAEGGGFEIQTFENVNVRGESSADLQMVANETVTVGSVGTIEYELPLLQAVADENLSEIESLLKNGADINAKDQNYGGISALFVAVENGNVEITRELIKLGADVNHLNDEKASPLMWIDGDATPELVKLLLSNGAKINATDDEGRTVLHRAVYSVDGEVLQILIDEGASLDAQNEDGETALMIAAEYDSLESVKILLASGASVNLRDEDGETALDKARSNEYEEIAQLLISNGAVGEK